MPDTEPLPRVEPGDDTIVIRSTSPRFATRAPDLVDAELIPADVKSACLAWQQRVFPPRPLIVRVVRCVYVAEEGLVFTSQGELLRSSASQHEAELIDRAGAAVRRAIAGDGVLPRHDLPLVLGKKRGAANYGHWMIEMLPMLHLALSRLADPRIGVLVHDVTEPRLGQVMMQTLRRLGVADARVRVSGLAPVFVRELIMVEGMTEHGSYMSPLVRDCHARIAHGIAGKGIERVFLQRGPGVGRQFQDERRVSQLAAERGYMVLSPAQLGLEGQIGLMRDARLIAGVMGAAMTNLIYARAGARAAVFAPATMPDTFFWFIANVCGLHYREIRCVQVGPGGDWDRSLDIGSPALRRALDGQGPPV